MLLSAIELTLPSNALMLLWERFGRIWHSAGEQQEPGFTLALALRKHLSRDPVEYAPNGVEPIEMLSLHEHRTKAGNACLLLLIGPRAGREEGSRKLGEGEV